MPGGATVRRAVVLILILLSCASAQRANELRPSGYVNDFAQVLSADTTRKIESIGEQLDERAKAQLAVVTVASLQGSDVETYAVDLFQRWGVGNKSTNRGVLILLAIRDHRYRIEVGYGLEPILPDGRVGGFGREAVPYLKSGDYNNAVLLLTNRVSNAIASDAHVQISSPEPAAPAAAAPPPQAGMSAVTLGIVLLVITFLLVFTPVRRLLWWLLLSGGGDLGDGSSGGGWGGGGFGGFGGGSSGGGGASGSW
jgi:uncharacterized protein